MPKRKKKIVIDKDRSEFKKRHGRFPIARPTEYHADKSRYNRRKKHKDEIKRNYTMPEWRDQSNNIDFEG